MVREPGGHRMLCFYFAFELCGIDSLVNYLWNQARRFGFGDEIGSKHQARDHPFR